MFLSSLIFVLIISFTPLRPMPIRHFFFTPRHYASPLIAAMKAAMSSGLFHAAIDIIMPLFSRHFRDIYAGRRH
jgi:hypothetical protein